MYLVCCYVILTIVMRKPNMGAHLFINVYPCIQAKYTTQHNGMSPVTSAQYVLD